ncbi:alcohol dehydrogenase zinc-binding domain-containing protein [Hyaloraphidium curvatum]|nr:alcohol dehydrogenase zinc-binding domain-containing protein [Hyaloraphidium curvatum]
MPAEAARMAWGRDVYGPPSVLTVRKLPVPGPGKGEVLVRVAASTVTSGDKHLLEGTPKAIRLFFGITGPWNPLVGRDVAGTVLAVGPGVEGFAVGDAVFGEAEGGGTSTHALVPSKRLARAPRSLPLADAAALPVAGCTALQALDAAGAKEGERVLVVGAAGAVGGLAVQMAVARGCVVGAACRGEDAKEMARKLGAGEIVEPGTWADGKATWDVVVDNAADKPVGELSAALRPGGRYVGVSLGEGGDWTGPIPRMLSMSLRGALYSEGRKLIPLASGATRADLEAVAGIVDAGKLKPVIQERFGFDRVVEAYEAVYRGHARGRVVVDVASDEK